MLKSVEINYISSQIIVNPLIYMGNALSFSGTCTCHILKAFMLTSLSIQ